MALTKDDKKALIERYKGKISEAKALFVLKPQAITPNEASELKKKLYEQDSSLNVVKNTLFKIALKDSGIQIEIEGGENAIVFAGDDFPAVAKIIKEFIKETEKAEIQRGFVEGQIIGVDQFNTLADLPSRDVLIAQVLSTIEAPISSFVRILSGNISGFINVVNAIKEQKS